MIASSESMIVSHGSDGLTYTFKICICSHELLGVHFAQHQESNSHEIWKIKPNFAFSMFSHRWPLEFLLQ